MSSSSSPTTLLHLDASPRGERSQSRRLGQKFIAAWRRAHPDATVISRDVGREPPPFVSEAWVEGAFAPRADQSASAREAIAVSNQYVDELLGATEIVITTPVYNLSLPAALKAWIDQIVRAGRTFEIKDGAYNGLAKVQRAIVIVASGGDSRLTSAAGTNNYLEPYLRAILGFIGIPTVEFVYAHSLGVQSPQLGQILNDAESAITELAAQAAA